MAAYPTIAMTHRIRPRGGRRVDVSDSGVVRSVDLNETTVYNITVTHPVIEPADRDTLLAFYDANRSDTNTIDLYGVTYNTQFISAPRVENVGPSFSTVTSELVGTKQ